MLLLQTYCNIGEVDHSRMWGQSF